MSKPVRSCRVCGCTDNDCRQCIEKTGEPCYWVAADLCSACIPEANEDAMDKLKTFQSAIGKLFPVDE